MRRYLLSVFALALFAGQVLAAPDLVTVDDKTTGGTLSAAEFNQVLDALKSGTRSATVQSVIINGVQGFFATGLEGTASGDLATIPVAKIKDKAIGIVNLTGTAHLYYFDATGTAAESVPAVIRPNDYATAGVWRLAGLKVASVDIAKTSGVAGRIGVYEENGTDTSQIGWEGAASRSGDLWFKFGNDDPAANSLMLFGVPVASVSQVSWVTLDIDLSSVSGSDDTIPSAKATKAYVDSGSASFTNKTFDANGTGNTLKQYAYLYLPGSSLKMRGSSVTAGSTDQTDILYGLPVFSGTADEATNWIDWIIQVPDDIDTAVDLTAKLHFRLGGADTGDHDYVLSMCQVAASAALACTPANAVNLAYTADGSGADGDIEITTETTLTDWKSNVTAGRSWRIRLARDGDDGTNDASTVASTPPLLVLKFGATN